MRGEQYPFEELADELEEYGTSRADFRPLSDEERIAVAKWLVRARSQVNTSNAPENKREGAYGWNMIQKKCHFHQTCGCVGIEMDEAKSLWRNYVYDEGYPPYESDKYV